MGDSSSEPPFVDEKWKLTKRGSVNARMTGSSCTSSSSSSSTSKANEAFLRRSDSVPHRSSFSRKCTSVVKEQRAKFYIVRRCVTMLMCWKDYRDP